jgi:hypothetical protein
MEVLPVSGLQQSIQQSLVDGKLPCQAAFSIARAHQVAPADVGREADAMDVRLSRCQLGLFGYGRKDEGQHRAVKPMPKVPHALRAAIVNAVSEDRTLTCVKAWHLAENLEVTKRDVADAAEALEVKIVACQLGAF